MKAFIKQLIKSNKYLFSFYWMIKNKDLKLSNIEKKIQGKENQVNISKLSNLNDCVIEIIGRNNNVIIKKCTDINKLKIFIKGDNNFVIIGDRVSFRKESEIWIEGDDCVLEIGELSSFEQSHLAVTENSSKLIIGKDCMFANDIDVRTGDSHSIINSSTNLRTNHAKDVVIGNHVWVASHCSILKGVVIRDNCVVGTRSVVTKPVTESGVLVAGNPAKILKRDINWDRKRL